MMIAILPLIAVSLGTPDDSMPELTMVVTSPRSAQVRLADLLGNADSIDGVRGDRNTFTFSITRADDAFELVATTSAGGDVTDIVIRDRVRANAGFGGLSWLVETMQETVAVTQLHVDEDGAVTLTTNEGMRYMAIPGRGSGGNDAVEARWAAAWDRSST